MYFDKRNISLFELNNLITRGFIKLEIKKEIDQTLDLEFIINNKIPIHPIFIAKQNLVIGSNVVGGLIKFMEKHEDKYLRIVQDFPISLYEIREYNEEDLEKIIYHIDKLR